MHSGSVIRQCSVAYGHFVWQLTVFVCIRNHSKTTQDSAKNVCSSAKMSSASGVEGLCILTPTAVADKNGGPRALRIEVGHSHAAPFLIDMFVYRMITPYCTKFDRLTNTKFMEIVGTRGTGVDKGGPGGPGPPPNRRAKIFFS